MFRAGLEAVIRASIDDEQFIPEGGQIEIIAADQLADSPWSSGTSNRY